MSMSSGSGSNADQYNLVDLSTIIENIQIDNSQVEVDLDTETEFNQHIHVQQEELDNLFKQAQKVARSHIEELYQSLKQKYKNSLNTYVLHYEIKLKEEKNETALVNTKLTQLQLLYDQNNRNSSIFKEKLATFMGSIRHRHESNNTLLKCFSFWNQLTVTIQTNRRTDQLAEKVSKNFVKSRVFSRFAYNLGTFMFITFTMKPRQ